MMNTHDAKWMNQSERSLIMTRYILGQLSEEERARLEEEYFADSDLLEEMVAVENELIDAYVAGKLSGAELYQFETHFLSARENRERVECARSLMRSGPQKEQSSPPSDQHVRANWRFPSFLPAGRFLVASIFLALLASDIWLAFKDIRLRQELAQLRSSQARLEQEHRELQQKNAELQAEMARQQIIPRQDVSPLAHPGQPTIVLTLSTDLARGHAKPYILPLSSGITNVVLMLESDGDTYPSYDISLETPEGTPLLHRKGLRSWATKQGRVTAVELPAATLQRGDYVVRLIGINPRGEAQEVDAYSFRVVSPIGSSGRRVIGSPEEKPR